MNNKTIWTIGHSIHSFDKFVNILKSFNIELIADIRSLPGSRRFPHFNKESMSITLLENGIEYIHFPGLGGRRKVKPDSVNTGWKLDSFRGYADYMETDDFKRAVNLLENTALKKRTAYMCAEVLWWRCHRSLVSDYLKLHEWKVIHIMDTGKEAEHSYTKPARISEGQIIYDTDDRPHTNV